RARVVTDAMFMAAAHTLADCVDQVDLNQGSLYPALPRIREVSSRIAAAVAGIAYQTELGECPAPNDLIGYVRARMYEPSYSVCAAAPSKYPTFGPGPMQVRHKPSGLANPPRVTETPLLLKLKHPLIR